MALTVATLQGKKRYNARAGEDVNVTDEHMEAYMQTRLLADDPMRQFVGRDDVDAEAEAGTNERNKAKKQRDKKRRRKSRSASTSSSSSSSSSSSRH